MEPVSIEANLREDEQEFPARRPSLLKASIRTAVGLTLIVLLVWRSDLESILRALGRAEPLLIVLAVVMMMALLVVSAFRWLVFLQRLDVRLPIRTVLRMYFVGSFFNAFLPTGVGGDAYKAVRLRSAPTTLATSFASVLLDRVAGIVALAAIALVAVAVRFLADDRSAVLLACALVSAAVIGGAIVLMGLGERLLGPGRSTWFGVRPRLRRMVGAVVRAGRDPRTVALSMGAGLAAQVLGIGAHLALASAIGLDITLPALTAALMIATVASTAPVTINGLGVREAVWVWSLGIYGIVIGEALAFALLVLGMSLATSAVGGLVYMIAGGDVGPVRPGRPGGAVPEPSEDRVVPGQRSSRSS